MSDGFDRPQPRPQPRPGQGRPVPSGRSRQLFITGAVLVVVAFVGVQWPTSYVLLGVIVVALLSQAARQIAGGREKI